MRVLPILGLAALYLSGCAADSRAGIDGRRAPQTAPAPAATAPASAAPGAGQRGRGLPYEIAGTEVWTVADPVSGRDYQVFISLPPSYAESASRRYPVLYVTDADYAFPVVRSIARRLNVEGPELDDFILVGLSYAVGEGGMPSRRRDYTPTPLRRGEAPGDDVHGGGDAYIAYVRDRVIPFIAGRYRTDERRRLFLGHSYGALLGSQILFTDPGLFAGYVLGSPSFWYDGHAIDRFEKDYARRHGDLDAAVYMYVGEHESPAFGKRYDMVGDARRMERTLRSRGYPSLRIELDVLADEDHLSVAPRGFTHGLKHLMASGSSHPGR